MPIIFTKPSAEHLAKIVEQVPMEYPDFKKLDEDLVKFYQKMRLTPEMMAEREEYVQRLQCYLTLETALSHYLGENGVWITSIVKYGSMATHCATRDSDLDICICASYSGAYQPSPAIILQAIYEDLQHNHHAKEYFGLEGVSDLVFISTAKVPILQFKLNGVEVDISVSFDIISPPKSVLDARLVNAYCQLDERFTILVIFLKSWMKSELGNTDFMRDFPNSYSLILMVIHVLQWHGIMPNLHETHPHLFNLEWQEESMYPLEWTDVMSHQQRSTNTLSVAQLLHIFSTQYSNNIIINCCKLDMRSGMLETRGERDNAPIVIQDVFDTRNPARSVRGNEMVQALQCVSKLFSNPKNLLFQRIWRVTRNKTYLLPR